MNKTKNKSAMVSMLKSTFREEHKHLVKVLRKGTPKQRRQEANEQEGELNQY